MEKNQRNKMANILDIVKGQEQQQINVNKLRELCSKRNVWDHFGLDKEGFLNLSKPKQTQLTSTFYFENVNNTAQHQAIDASIGSIINNQTVSILKRLMKMVIIELK